LATAAPLEVLELEEPEELELVPDLPLEVVGLSSLATHL
jgi:hypothetical protein